MRNTKWLINCSHNPHKSLIESHLDAVSKKLDLHSLTYDKIILLGDFNTEIDEQHMQSFCDNYSLKILIRQPTCSKNFGKPACIDLILTNMPCSFQRTCVIETGLSGFHLMTLTVMRKNFKKVKPRIKNYRLSKNFSTENYRKCLFNELRRETFVINDRGFEKFRDMSIKLLNKYAPIKIKYKRGNHMPFITKDLSKATLKRSQLRNDYLKNKTDSNRMLYKKQRNYCGSLLRKS